MDSQKKSFLNLLFGKQEDGASFALSPESQGWATTQIVPARVHLMLPNEPDSWDEIARDAASLLTGLSPSQLKNVEFRLSPLPEPA